MSTHLQIPSRGRRTPSGTTPHRRHPLLLLTACAALTAVAALVPSASAWGCNGHMLVAEIAHRQLTPSNRAKADSLMATFSAMGPFPRSPDLVQVGCWADDLKGWRQYAMKPWHYVDIPYNPENLSVVLSPYVSIPVPLSVAARTSAPVAKAADDEHSHCGGEEEDEEVDPEDQEATGKKGANLTSAAVQPPRPLSYAVPSPVYDFDIFDALATNDENGGNVVTAIRNMVVALKASIAVPEYSISFAFANLVHFIGDVHQPLHATTRYSAKYPHGDRGGNLVKVIAYGKETNLHSLWDNMCLAVKPKALKRPLNAADRGKLTDYADYLEDTFAFPEGLVVEEMASAMAWESHLLAVNTTYPGAVEGQPLSEAYLDRCKEVCEGRLMLGGLRLGRMLNQLLEEMDIEPVVQESNRAFFRTSGRHDDGKPLAWWKLW